MIIRTMSPHCFHRWLKKLYKTLFLYIFFQLQLFMPNKSIVCTSSKMLLQMFERRRNVPNIPHDSSKSPFRKKNREMQLLCAEQPFAKEKSFKHHSSLIYFFVLFLAFIVFTVQQMFFLSPSYGPTLHPPHMLQTPSSSLSSLCMPFCT